MNFNEDEARAAFEKGQVLILRDWQDAWAEMAGAASNAENGPKNGTIGVARLPGSSALGGESVAVAACSKHRKSARALVRFLSSEETQRDLYNNSTVYTQVRLVELDSLDKLAVATLVPALIATAVRVYRDFGTNRRRLTVTALLLLVVVFGLTLVVNLPINADQLHWNTQSPPADWTTVRDRWQIAHAVRTTAAR